MNVEIIWAIRDARGIDALQKSLLWTIASRGEAYATAERNWIDAGMKRSTYFKVRKSLIETGVLKAVRRMDSSTVYAVDLGVLQSMTETPESTTETLQSTTETLQSTTWTPESTRQHSKVNTKNNIKNNIKNNEAPKVPDQEKNENQEEARVVNDSPSSLVNQTEDSPWTDTRSVSRPYKDIKEMPVQYQHIQQYAPVDVDSIHEVNKEFAELMGVELL